jgi:peptidoglycan-associated lipoprotein
MLRTIFPSTLLLALLLTGCKKDKPSATLPVDQPIADTSGGDRDTKPAPQDETDDALPAPSSNPSLTSAIFFEFDSSSLSEDGRAALTANAEWLLQDPTRKLVIEGHTDEAGTDEYNLALGDRRARVAQDYLVRLGVDPDRVSIVTYGEERPAGETDSENRRAMFVSERN